MEFGTNSLCALQFGTVGVIDCGIQFQQFD